MPGKGLLVSREMWDDGVEAKENLWLHMKSQGTEDLLVTNERYAQAKVTHGKIFFLRSIGPVYKESFFCQDWGKIQNMRTWVSTLFLFSPSPSIQSLSQSVLSIFFIFLFNRGTIESCYCHVTVQCFTLAISFSSILHKTLKFEFSGT